MKTSVKTKLVLVTLSAVLLAACNSQSSSSPSLSTAAPTAEEASQITHIAPYDSASNVAISPEGLYEVAWLRLGACNLLYLDAATQKEIYLCSSPSCAHNTEACSSYLAVPEGSYGYNLFYFQDHLYAFQYTSVGSLRPYIMEMAPDGTQRRTVLTLDSGENFTGKVLGYGDSILCEITTVGEDMVTHSQLERIDLETGSRELLYRYPDEQGRIDISLQGACGTCLYYLSSREGGNQYYQVDLSQGSEAFQEWQNHPVGPVFDDVTNVCTIQDEYLCTYDTGTGILGYQNLITGETVEFPAPALGEGEELYGLVHLYDDRFGLTIDAADGTPCTLLLDPGTHELTGVRYTSDRENGMTILGQYGDWLLYRIRSDEIPLKDQENAGLSGEVTYRDVYGMIQKEDYWNGNPGQEIPFPDL